MAEHKPKAAPKQKTAAKPIHATASPFTASKADVLAQPHHDIILGRLIDALEPIKAYRMQQSVSKGNRHGKKRKRGPVSADDTPIERDEIDHPAAPPPPVPQHTLLGFNAVTRHLEALSTNSAPKTMPASAAPSSPPTSDSKLPHVAAVFLLRPLDDLIYSHLPTLCHTASLAYADQPATRLILMDPKAETRVAGAVGLPRISLLGVLDGGAETEGLVAYLREHVEPVAVPWLEEAKAARWMGTKVDVL